MHITNIYTNRKSDDVCMYDNMNTGIY